MRTRLSLVALPAAFALAALPAYAASYSFARTLTVNGNADITIKTGSGKITLTAGPAGQVHIVGNIRSTWGASEARMKELADHPPVEQTGHIVEVGTHVRNLNNISIDYEIQAPAGSTLHASSGSGSISDDGVGNGAQLSTGSGSIRATGLQGMVTISTGSGSIAADFSGPGTVKAETGSGSIDIRNLHGGLHAETGSGHINVSGTPSASWQIETGSGGVDVSTGNAAFDLDASCGSGGIQSDREVASRSSDTKHHLAGKVNGGGPTVRIETGSGSIHIQ